MARRPAELATRAVGAARFSSTAQTIVGVGVGLAVTTVFGQAFVPSSAVPLGPDPSVPRVELAMVGGDIPLNAPAFLAPDVAPTIIDLEPATPVATTDVPTPDPTEASTSSSREAAPADPTPARTAPRPKPAAAVAPKPPEPRTGTYDRPAARSDDDDPGGHRRHDGSGEHHKRHGSGGDGDDQGDRQGGDDPGGGGNQD